MSMPFGRRVVGSLPHLPINRGFRARLKHRDRDRFERLRRAAWRLMLDPMEPRVLLSADPFGLATGTYDTDVMASGAVSGSTLTVSIDDDLNAGTEIGVRIATGATAQEVIITDRHNRDVEIYRGDLTGISTLTINGDQGDDHFAVDFDASTLESSFELKIVGQSGADSVDFIGFDEGYQGQIAAYADSIRVADGVSLGTAASKVGKVTFNASGTNTGRTGGSASVDDNPSYLIDVDGSIRSSSTVDIFATAATTGTTTLTGVAESFVAGADATIDVAAASVIDATAIDIQAWTRGTIKVEANNTLAFVANVTLRDRAEVDVAGTLTGNSVKVNALNSTDLTVTLTSAAYTATDAVFGTQDGATIGFDALASTLNATRAATVTIADGADVSGSYVSISGEISGDVTSAIESTLFGLAAQVVDDTATVTIGSASVTSTGVVAATAKNKSTVSSEAIVASNTVTGMTGVSLTGATVSGSAVILSANDTSNVIVQAKDFDIGLAGFTSISLPFGLALNEVTRSVSTVVSGGSVTAATGAVEVSASNEMKLVSYSGAQQLNVPTGYVNPTGFALNIAGTLAVNELLGGTTASVTEATITAAGDVDIIATSNALLDSKTEATAQTVGGDGAAIALAVAYNNLGRDVDYTDFEEGIDTILGLGLEVTYTGFETVALVSGSTLSGRDVSVLATTEQMLLDATTTNVAKNESIAASRKTKSYAAGIVLATNMVTSATRASVQNDGNTRSTITSTRNVSVKADDGASINANVKLVANATAATDGGASNVDALIGGISPADYRTNGTIQTLSLIHI